MKSIANVIVGLGLATYKSPNISFRLRLAYFDLIPACGLFYFRYQLVPFSVRLPRNHSLAPTAPASLLPRYLSPQKLPALSFIFPFPNRCTNSHPPLELLLDHASDALNLLPQIACLVFKILWPRSYHFSIWCLRPSRAVTGTLPFYIHDLGAKALLLPCTLYPFVSFANAGA